MTAKRKSAQLDRKKLFSDPDHCTVRWIDEKLTGEEQEMAEGLPRVRKVILYGRGFAESK